MTKAFHPALQSACAALYLIAGAASSIAEEAKGVPRKVGQCVRTEISELGSRLEGAPDSGSAVAYANGVTGVSYDVVTPSPLARGRSGHPLPRFRSAQLPAGRRQGQGLFCCQLADAGALVSS